MRTGQDPLQAGGPRRCLWAETQNKGGSQPRGDPGKGGISLMHLRNTEKNTVTTVKSHLSVCKTENSRRVQDGRDQIDRAPRRRWCGRLWICILHVTDVNGIR